MLSSLALGYVLLCSPLSPHFKRDCITAVVVVALPDAHEPGSQCESMTRQVVAVWVKKEFPDRRPVAFACYVTKPEAGA